VLLQGAATFGLAIRDGEVELSGGSDPSRQPDGGLRTMSDAELHRQVQTWWNEHEARLREKKRDPNLDKKPTARVNRSLVSAAERASARDSVLETLQQARRAPHLSAMDMSTEVQLSDDEMAVITMLLDDDLLPEHAG
jgi:hypothetical protein